MGRISEKDAAARSQTLPSSPSHSFSSSSSSDFEFTISSSPRKASAALCPADELFYKGQLLPLHLSPRLSMVRTLFLASSSISSSSTASDPRDSIGSSNSTDSNSSFSSDLALLAAASATDCDSSRPSSVADPDDEFKRLNCNSHQIKKSKYFSLSRFSSVFKKENKTRQVHDNNISIPNATSSSVKRMSATAREVIRKYLKKVKPLYEKFSQQKQQQKMTTTTSTASFAVGPETEKSSRETEQLRTVRGGGCREENSRGVSHSFSGNLRYPRRRSCVSSCPSSMRSSPSHSGVLSRSGAPGAGRIGYSSDMSSMEELQSAIQGAIAHCKNSLMQNNKNSISNEI